MDALRETKLMNEFKKLILGTDQPLQRLIVFDIHADQLHAIFGPKYPDACTFSVTTSVSVSKSTIELESTAQIFLYTTLAIVYTIPKSFTEWELLRESSKLGSISSAIESVLGDWQLEMERNSHEF